MNTSVHIHARSSYINYEKKFYKYHKTAFFVVKKMKKFLKKSV